MSTMFIKSLRDEAIGGDSIVPVSSSLSLTKAKKSY